MALCTILGIDIPCSVAGNASTEIFNVGEYARTFSGGPYSTLRARGVEYRGRTPLVPRATSLLYEALLTGQGHGWRFATAGSGATADLFSSKGLGDNFTEGTITTVDTGGPVSNAGRLVLDTDEYVEWRLGQPFISSGAATFALWVKSTDFFADAWTHLMLEYVAGVLTAYWVNAVSTATGSVIPNLTLADDDLLTLTYGGSASMSFAEMVALPYRASSLRSDWASYSYNSGTGRAAPSLPYLPLTGDWPRTGSDTVLGEVQAPQQVTVVESGTTSLYESFDFTLRGEVE